MQYNGPALIRAREGVRVDLWKSAQQPQLPVSLERLGDPILTVAYNLVNISATTDVWYGFQDINGSASVCFRYGLGGNNSSGDCRIVVLWGGRFVRKEDNFLASFPKRKSLNGSKTVSIR